MERHRTWSIRPNLTRITRPRCWPRRRKRLRRYLRTDELLALQKTPEDWLTATSCCSTTVTRPRAVAEARGTEVEEAARRWRRQVSPAIRLLRRAVLGARLRGLMLEKMCPGSTSRSASCSATAAALTRRASRGRRRPRHGAPGRSFYGLVEGRRSTRRAVSARPGFEQLSRPPRALTDWDERIWILALPPLRHRRAQPRRGHHGERREHGAGAGKADCPASSSGLWKARALLVGAFRRAGAPRHEPRAADNCNRERRAAAIAHSLADTGTPMPH